MDNLLYLVESIKLIKKDFKILYLDQFASSNLALKNEGIWPDLKSLLEYGVKKGRIICPIPYDHYIETSQANLEQALKIDNYFSALSNSFMFKSTAYTNSQLIISELRKNKLTIDTFIVKRIKENVLNGKNELNYYKKQKNEFNRMIEEATTESNKLRKNRKSQKKEKETKKIMYKVISHIATDEFINRLNDLLKTGNITIKGDKFSFIEVPNWIDQTIFRLVRVHKMNLKETKKLISIIKKYGFSKFPTLDIRFSLYAIISIESKHEDAGDHVDIERIASGLPVSDYFLIDRQRKFEITSLELDTKYNTKVYCGNKIDLLNFRSELENIVN